MTNENYLEQIRERVFSSSQGSVFITSDFSDIADTNAINQSLFRMLKTNQIRRVLRGVYEYPEYSNFLKENIAPSPDKVAQALARNYSWNIVPNGDTALNLIGLSTQVPAEWTYVSDGPYKEYAFDNTVIRFKHTANKDISKLPYKSALLVQAIKAIGKEKLDDKALRKMSSLLSDEEKTALLTDGKYMTTWIFDAVKKICNGGITS